MKGQAITDGGQAGRRADGRAGTDEGNGRRDRQKNEGTCRKTGAERMLQKRQAGMGM